MILNLLYRRILIFSDNVSNILRITNLKLKYEGISIDYRSKIGKNCDIRCVKGSKLKIRNSNIGVGTQLVVDNGGQIQISKSFIGPHCVIVARCSIIIHQNCQIAEMVTIRDQNHKFGEAGKTIEEQGFDSGPIHIGENVWIAAKSSILKDVFIGNNVVIGAHSLVNKSCEANSVYVGIPAKKLKN